MTSVMTGIEQATIVSRIRDWAAATPDKVALREKRFGVWRPITWAEYWESVQTVAHALLALGVNPGDRVAVHSENRPEWLITDAATVAIRAATVGLYPTNPAPEVDYLLSNSGAKVLLAEDQEQLDKALASTSPDLETIVYVEPRGIVGHYDDARLMSWPALLDLGAAHRTEHPGAVEAVMAAADPADIATLVYTSGTTGPPKGAMLTVSNVEFAIEKLVLSGGFCDPPPHSEDLTLSYLPLCHVAERIFTSWFNVAVGSQVNFAECIETVPQNLREVQPTLLFGVPRIWEKLLASVRIKIDSATWTKRKYAYFWLRRADRIAATLERTGGVHTVASRLIYAVGWLLFFRSLRAHLGMRFVRYAGSGAAPIAPEVLRFFMGIGIPMHEVYGMTENSAIATANRRGRVKLGTVGEPHEGTEVRIDDETGEILTRHAGVFAGYWRNPEATAAAIDAEGWLHTGDVGTWVDGTHIKITDRMKDIIITAGGKNISPSEIENALKASPYIKEAVVIGDERRYLTALIGIEMDTTGEWAQRRRIAYTTYRDLSEQPEVRKLVQRIVNAVNDRFASVEQVKQFRMLPKELDHEDGELTATQKVKRSAIMSAFGELVEEMYR